MQLLLKYFTNLTEDQIDKFTKLGNLYQDWNLKINVVSRKDIDELYLRHVLHSLGIAKVIQFKAGTTILDVGTGGGFPGIPLAILFPDAKFTLVDSIGKKISVVKAVAEEIGLENIEAYHQRAEKVKGRFDFVVSRAVTRMKKFLPWINQKIDESDPSVDVCQGECKKTKKFHHACNTFWLEEEGITNPVLKKLCIDFMQIEEHD